MITDRAIEVLAQGGWPMVPLAACSVVAATIIIERAVALRRGAVVDRRITGLVDDYAGESSATGAIATCRAVDKPLSRLIEQVLLTRHAKHAQLIQTMHAAGRRQVEQLERGLTVLEIIAGVSPLLGLLGTVLGMVRVFNTVTSEGIGNPQVLSSGISQALMTTVAGLCIAIPSLACFSWFSKRVEAFAAEMQDIATRLIGKIAEASQTANQPSENA